MTLSAVVIGHERRDQVEQMVKLLGSQTRPPEEIILTVCCMDTGGLEVIADIVLRDIHRDDIGQSKCDFGARMATQEYVGFFSCDDGYALNYIERMLQEDADLIYCGFQSTKNGLINPSRPHVGGITRGCFFVRTNVAQYVGYNHRVYEGDGLFVQDVMNAGASQASIHEVLHYHN